MTKETFAKRLQTVRERAGMSQYALAKKTGLSRQYVNQLENAENEPSWTTVQLFALAMGVDYAELAEPDLKLPDTEPVKPRGRPKKKAKPS